MNETLKQIHRPSRATAIAFFLFSLAVAAFVIVWVFFLNKGTLLVEGDAPFRMSMTGHQKECTSSPCILKLAPRTYSVSIQKEGFYEDVQTAEIVRWEETKLAAHFQFIPVLREIGELILPFPNAPLRPPFIGNKKFENFPKDVKEAEFSGSGNQAILLLGKEIYLYDVTERSVTETNFLSVHSPAWVSENIAYLGESESKHILKIWKDGKSEPIVTFERPFKNPKLLGATSKALIIDESNGNFSYYLVDLTKKSRKRLEISNGARSAKWVGEYIVFSEGESADQKIFAVHAETGKQIPLPAVDTKNVIEMKPGVLLFFSKEKQGSGESKLGPSISEALEITSLSTAGQIPTAWYLTKFDMESGASQTLASVPLKENQAVHQLTIDPDGEKLYFAQNQRLFEIILEK